MAVSRVPSSSSVKGTEIRALGSKGTENSALGSKGMEKNKGFGRIALMAAGGAGGRVAREDTAVEGREGVRGGAGEGLDREGSGMACCAEKTR